jgi:hypothetical protein
MEERLLEILNNYSETDIPWIQGVLGENTILIDPMDYHKLASEIATLFREFAEWIRTETNINDKFLTDWLYNEISTDELFDYYIHNIKK